MVQINYIAHNICTTNKEHDNNVNKKTNDTKSVSILYKCQTIIPFDTYIPYNYNK